MAPVLPHVEVLHQYIFEFLKEIVKLTYGFLSQIEGKSFYQSPKEIHRK